MFADEHGKDALAAEAILKGDDAFGFGATRADDGGVLSERMGAHDGESGLGLFGRDGESEFAFVGEVDGIEAKDLTEALNFGADGDLCGVDGDVEVGGLSDLVEGGGESAASEVAHGAGSDLGIE